MMNAARPARTDSVDIQRLRRAVQVTSTSDSPPQQFTDSENQAESERIELQGRRQFYNLRLRWSSWLIGWITSLLVFQFIITVLIGIRFLDFKDYVWFLPLVTFENFLQIVGMGLIIVKFLYPGQHLLVNAALRRR